MVVKALFPLSLPVKPDDKIIEILEQVALSLGLSLALVPIVALLLNFTPWGIRLTPLALSLLAFTVVLGTAGLFREYTLKQKPVSTPDFSEAIDT